MQNVDTSKACGAHGVGNALLKASANNIACSQFFRFINQSLSMDVFPLKWKLANVVPIFKKDDRQSKENYRPISLLPSLSKICEKIVFDIDRVTLSKDFQNITLPRASAFYSSGGQRNTLAQVPICDSVRRSLFKYNSAAGKDLYSSGGQKNTLAQVSMYDPVRRSLSNITIYHSTVVKCFYSSGGLMNTLAQVPMMLFPFNETAAGGIITRSRGYINTNSTSVHA